MNDIPKAPWKTWGKTIKLLVFVWYMKRKIEFKTLG